MRPPSCLLPYPSLAASSGRRGRNDLKAEGEQEGTAAFADRMCCMVSFNATHLLNKANSERNMWTAACSPQGSTQVRMALRLLPLICAARLLLFGFVWPLHFHGTLLPCREIHIAPAQRTEGGGASGANPIREFPSTFLPSSRASTGVRPFNLPEF